MTMHHTQTRRRLGDAPTREELYRALKQHLADQEAIIFTCGQGVVALDLGNGSDLFLRPDGTWEVREA